MWPLFSGLLAGINTTLILHPLDVIKIRLQVQVSPSSSSCRPFYASAFNAGKSILRQEGIRGLYQGAMPNMTGASLAWGSYFFFYDHMKRHLRSLRGNTESLGPLDHMACAGASGALALLVTNPIWVVKTRMCLNFTPTDITASLKPPTQRIPRYTGLFHALKTIARTEGIVGLYKGLVPGLFGVSHGALQFMAYEEMKKGRNKYKSRPPNATLSNSDYVLMAALSKLFAVTVTYPYQVHLPYPLQLV